MSFTIKIKNVSVIMILGIIILMPNLQYIEAEPWNSYNSIPAHAEKLRESLVPLLASHPDWVYMMSWNGSSEKIDYIGPASSNPHILHGISMAPTGVIDKGISTNADTTNGGLTSEWKEVADFTNQKLTSSSTDLFQILDALN